ncbi:MAG: hypothetical protein U0230_16650 [Polyangiales bacterium]
MSVLLALALTLTLVAISAFGGAAVGAIDTGVGILIGGPTLGLAIVFFILHSLGRGQAKDAERVKELPARGLRLRGRVKDAVPYASSTGGAVLRPEGAQMVLQVELERNDEGARIVTIHVVEPSETARARIGTTVTVLEHPDDPALRTLEGFLPNGVRAPDANG